MNTQATGKIRPITKKQLFAKTRKHFGLTRLFDPIVLIHIGYAGHWEILNKTDRPEYSVSDEQKAFMLDLIKEHGGFSGVQK
jgi:hypothetical protein